MRKPHSRSGLNRVEVQAALVALLIANCVAVYCGYKYGRFGFLLGFAGGGVAGLVLGGVGLVAFETVMAAKDGTFSLPPCKNGKCRGAGWLFRRTDYVIINFAGSFAYRCRCGDVYVQQERRFLQSLSDGSLRPYKTWKPFRGWFPDVPTHVA